MKEVALEVYTMATTRRAGDDWAGPLQKISAAMRESSSSGAWYARYILLSVILLRLYLVLYQCSSRMSFELERLRLLSRHHYFWCE